MGQVLRHLCWYREGAAAPAPRETIANLARTAEIYCEKSGGGMQISANWPHFDIAFAADRNDT